MRETVDNRIDIKEVIIWIFSRWKIMLGMMLFIGACIFVYEYISFVNNVEGEDEKESFTYEMTEDEYENQIRLIEERIVSNYEYVRDSLIMQIDPTQVQVETVQYRLTEASVCNQIICQKDVICEEIAKLADCTDEGKYIGELLEIQLMNVGEETFGFKVTVKGKNTEICDEIIELSEKVIVEMLENLRDIYGEVDCFIDARESYVTMDLDLKEKQMSHLSYIQPSNIAVLEKIIQGLEKELKQLRDEENGEDNGEDNVNIDLVHFIKFSIISVVGGLLFSGGVLCLLYLLNNKIKTIGEISNLYHLNILEVWNEEGKNVENNRVNECIEYELVHGTHKEKSRTNYLIIGIQEEMPIELESVKNDLQAYKEINIEYVNHLENDVESYKRIDEADEVILYLIIEKDSYTQIEKVIETIQRRNAHIFGAIIRK